MLAPIAWRTPPRGYGPWEQVASTLTEALVERSVEVTLFATGDSVTRAELVSVVPHGYEVDHSYDVKVQEALHIATCFECAAAGRFDLIHNHFDFLPLAWSRLVPVPVVTTIHGFSSRAILPAYRRYDGHVHYVAVSDADRHPDLHYAATIHHGLDLAQFPYRPQPDPDGHLLFFGRIHPDKGTHTAIELARAAHRPLRIAGIIQDHGYFQREVEPRLGGEVVYLGPVAGAGRAAVLGAATALVHPVAFEEPFGLSVIEALACGTPVVAYRRGALSELIRPGENGLLAHDIPSALDALARIETIDRAGCRADAERRFSAARMADDYLRLYKTILDPAPGTRP
jgi:glycosyltransferase involved in cell wall biosynthesis